MPPRALDADVQRGGVEYVEVERIEYSLFEMDGDTVDGHGRNPERKQRGGGHRRSVSESKL